MNPGTKPETPEIHRGKRCGICAWALYDGAWCQNPNCIHVGKEPPSTIRLSNEEFLPWVSKRCMDAISAEAELAAVAKPAYRTCRVGDDDATSWEFVNYPRIVLDFYDNGATVLLLPNSPQDERLDVLVEHGEDQLAAVKAEADRLRAALEDVLKSAIPNERDHPRMHAAWMIAREALAKQEGAPHGTA